MSVKEYLDYCVQTYYSSIISKYRFELIAQRFDAIGAMYVYRNHHFQLRIINDRGIVELDIVSLFDTNNYCDISRFYALIYLVVHENEKMNAWDFKMILTKRMSCEEQVRFIDENYDLISELLSRENYKKTINKLGDLGNKQAGILFGGTW